MRLQDPRATTLLAEAANGHAGDAVVARTPPPACVRGPEPIERARFYLAEPFIGRGPGAPRLRAVHREARQQRAHTIWLGVHDRNLRAVGLYERFGFTGDAACHSHGSTPPMRSIGGNSQRSTAPAPLGDKEPDALRTVFGNRMFKCFVCDDGRLVGAGRALADGADCSCICDIAVVPRMKTAMAIFENQQQQLERGHLSDT